MEQEEDQFSNLPKIILDNILSRLPESDAARTSVLSKDWLDTWYTFPILSFSDTQITGLFPASDLGRMLFPELIDDFVRKIQNYIYYVNTRLLRFYDNGLVIKKLKLVVYNGERFSYMLKDIDLWLKLASECGVEGIHLYLPYGLDQDECYVLPKGVIEVKSITELVLMGGIKVDTAFMNHSIKFFSLRVLSLKHVFSRDENAIEHLISCCPLIEHITLRFVDNMKSLSIHGLLKLKTVKVEGIQEVYIDAPYLEKLRFCPDDFFAPYKIGFDRCQNLKYLSLESCIIANKWFLELFPKFPFLESLELDSCTMSEKINISSVQLKVLEISFCSDMKEINIDAPNLLSFVYYSVGCGSSDPIISYLRSSSQLKVYMNFFIDYHHHLCNLREFVQNIKPQNVLSSLSIYIRKPFEDVQQPVVFQASSPPPSIKHLHLSCIPQSETLFSSILNILLSSCCPAFISLNPPHSKAFIEFLYETLIERKGDDCLCSSSDTKCWWHGLKNVKVISSMKIDDNIDFKTILELLPIGEKFSFMLEF